MYLSYVILYELKLVKELVLDRRLVVRITEQNRTETLLTCTTYCTSLNNKQHINTRSHYIH